MSKQNLFRRGIVLPHRRFALLFVLLLSGLSACEDNPELAWRPKIVAPLAFGNIGINSQSSLRNIAFTVELETDLGVPGGLGVIVPAVNNVDSEPDDFEITDPPFVEIGVGELRVEGVLRNPYAITIDAGLVIAMRNQGSDTVIIAHTTPVAIGPNASYRFSEVVNQGVIKPQLEMLVENFSSEGSNGQPVDVSSNRIRVDFNLDLPKLDYILYPPDISSSFDINSSFDIGLEEEDLEDLDGSLHLLITSEVGLNFDLNIGFLDANENLLATVTDVTIPPGTESNPTQESTLIDAVSVLDNLPRTRFLRILATFDTFGQPGNVRIDDTTDLRFKLLGDLEISVDTN